MTFSATEAAFEGFRLVRRHPLVILFWGLAYLVMFAVLFALFGGSLASIVATTESLQGTQPSPGDLEALGQTWGGLIWLVVPLSLVIGAVLNTAIARAIVRPADRAFGYLRLGADELRVIVVSVVMGLLIGVASALLLVTVGFGAGLAAQVNQGLAVLAAVVLGLGAIALLIWVSLRLSLAVPITVAERRIALFNSFALTRGRTAPLLGMAVLSFVMYILVSLLGTIIAMPVSLMPGAVTSFGEFDGLTTLQIVQAAGPVIAVWMVVNALLSALQLAVLSAPFSAAYRDIKGLPLE